MPQVSVTINGRQFRMACEDGEEARVTHLAEDLDGRIVQLRARFGEIGDMRLTVMAALALADELSEVKEKLERLEPELAKLQEASVVSAAQRRGARLPGPGQRRPVLPSPRVAPVEARSRALEGAQATQAAVIAALNAAAERIESLARRLNQTLVDASVPMG